MNDINEGEILWIEPARWPVAGCPDGFALQVTDVLGWADPDSRKVYVRGAILPRFAGQLRPEPVVLAVPLDQRRAVAGRPPHPLPDQTGAHPYDRSSDDPAWGR